MTNPSAVKPETQDTFADAAKPRLGNAPAIKVPPASLSGEQPVNDLLDLGEDQVTTIGRKTILPEEQPLSYRLAYQGGLALTALWLVSCFVWVFYNNPSMLRMGPVDLGVLLTGVLAPVALFWFTLAQIQRGADIQRHAEALRAELQAIIFPTEERAQRVGRDIERLCRQAAELAGASRAVIKAISRARQGLRTEIRDFVGVSRKTEFHIDKLAGVLHERATKLLDLTGEIETRTSTIDAKTQAGADAWDHATLSVLERTAEMEVALTRGVDKVLDAADQAGGKVKDVEQKIAASIDFLHRETTLVAGKLESTGAAFELRSAALNEHSLKLSATARAVTAATDRQLGELQTTGTQTAEALARAGQLLEGQRAALGQGAELLQAQTQIAAGKIEDGAARVEAAVETLGTRIRDVEQRLETQAGSLRNAVGSLGSEATAVETAGNAAVGKIGDAANALSAGAAGLDAAAQRAALQLGQSAQATREQADHLLRETAAEVTRLELAGNNAASRVQDIAALLGRSREQVEQAAAQAGAHVETLSGAAEAQAAQIGVATAGIVERLDAVHNALTRPLRDITVAVAEADARHAQIETTLRRRVSDLNDASAKAQETTDAIRTVLRDQAHEISTLSGQIAGHTRSVNDQLEQQARLLGMEVKDALAQSEKVGGALEIQAGRLRGVAGDAARDIAQLEGQIAGRYAEIETAATRSTETLRDMEETLDVRGRQVKAQAQGAATAIHGVVDVLGRASAELQPALDNVLNRTHEMQGRFERLQDGFGDLAESNLAKLQRMGVAFDERLESLRIGADQAAELLQSSGDHLQTRTQDIERAAAAASDKMYDIESSLRGQATDIHLITDQAQLRIESIQKAINEQFHELSEAVGQAMARITDVGTGLSRTAEHLDATTDRAATRMDEAGGHALAQSNRLEDAVAQSLRQTQGVIEQARREAEALVEASKVMFDDLDRAGEAIAERARDFTTQVNAALATGQHYNDTLKQQGEAVAASSGRSAERVGAAAAQLSGQLDRIGAAADHAVMQIDTSRGALSSESDRLLSVSAAAVRSAEEASSAFSRQSDALSRAIHEAGQHIEKIRAEEGRVQRQAFLGAAKFIVESLHSLSVDLTRTLDGEVPERTWKAFQRGDLGAFTRRLAGVEGNLSIDRVRDKFAADGEFRNYVQRFLRQFEEMFDQAAANDHGGLLAGTFISSDMGKLYQLLCAAAGQEPRLRREERRAA